MTSSFSLIMNLMLISKFAIFSKFEEGLISLLLSIDSKIYGLFASFYNLYIEIASARIFDVGAFDTLINTIYVLVGVVALFILTFSFLQSMANPDDVSKTTKNTKDLVLRLAISIALTCLTPVIFDFLYDFQYSILSNQVIPKTIVGGGTINDINISIPQKNGGTKNHTIKELDLSKEALKSNGYSMAFYVLNGFLYPADKRIEVTANAKDYFGGSSNEIVGYKGCIKGNDGQIIGTIVLNPESQDPEIGYSIANINASSAANICGTGILDGNVSGELEKITANSITWTEASAVAMSLGDFDLLTVFSKNIIDGDMEYTFIVSTVAGIILIWMMFSFCLDLGVRAAKLVVYQILAPISFLVSVMPSKKDLMSKWFKAVLATWFEVFTRVALVCGVALIVSKFVSSISFGNMNFIAKAIIVLGLVTFAKQAPKAIGEVTGINAGEMKLGIKEKFKEGLSAIPGAVVAGTLAKKTISGIDAKRNGQNFADGWRRIEGKGPLANSKKWINSMLPYSASNSENRKKADEQRKALESKVKTGEAARTHWTDEIMKNEKYRDELLAIRNEDGSFALNEKGEKLYKKAESSDYIKYLAATDSKYSDLGKAYTNRSVSKKNMLSAKAEYEAAQQSGNAAAISAASKKYNEFKDSYDAFDQEWKQLIGSSKFKHENEVFSSMKYIEDRDKGLVVSEPVNNGYKATKNSQKTESSIPISNSFGNGPRRDNDSNSQKQKTEDIYNQLISQYNSAKTTEERNKIKKQIDDFERKH